MDTPPPHPLPCITTSTLSLSLITAIHPQHNHLLFLTMHPQIHRLLPPVQRPFPNRVRNLPRLLQPDRIRPRFQVREPKIPVEIALQRARRATGTGRVKEEYFSGGYSVLGGVDEDTAGCGLGGGEWGGYGVGGGGYVSVQEGELRPVSFGDR